MSPTSLRVSGSWGSDATVPSVVSGYPTDQGGIQIFKDADFSCNMALKHKVSPFGAQPETMMCSNTETKLDHVGSHERRVFFQRDFQDKAG